MVMSTTRFLQIYIVQGTLCVFMIYVGIRVLKRNPKKRLNQIFSAFFFLSGAGAPIINFIYAPIDIPSLQGLVEFFNILAYIVMTMGLIFLLLFILIIEKSEKVINTPKQIIIIVSYAVLLSMLYIMPDTVVVSIELDSINYNPPAYVQKSPVWYPLSTAYVLIITTVTLVLSIFFSLKVSRQFEDKELSKKWRYFTIGVILLWSVALMIVTTNYLAPLVSPTDATESTIRLLSGLIQLVLISIGAYFTYYGVGKQV
jgi:hypothetical protein